MDFEKDLLRKGEVSPIEFPIFSPVTRAPGESSFVRSNRSLRSSCERQGRAEAWAQGGGKRKWEGRGGEGKEQLLRGLTRSIQQQSVCKLTMSNHYTQSHKNFRPKQT